MDIILNINSMEHILPFLSFLSKIILVEFIFMAQSIKRVSKVKKFHKFLKLSKIHVKSLILNGKENQWDLLLIILWTVEYYQWVKNNNLNRKLNTKLKEMVLFSNLTILLMEISVYWLLMIVDYLTYDRNDWWFLK